jgi:hypothetical protein
MQLFGVKLAQDVLYKGNTVLIGPTQSANKAEILSHTASSAHRSFSS